MMRWFQRFNIDGVYHFTPSSDTRQFIPFVSLGIGNTSTDLTEIPVHAVYRTRAGMKYYILPAVGLRVYLPSQRRSPAPNKEIQPAIAFSESSPAVAGRGR
jgi:hypothetical protein